MTIVAKGLRQSKPLPDAIGAAGVTDALDARARSTVNLARMAVPKAAEATS